MSYLVNFGPDALNSGTMCGEEARHFLDGALKKVVVEALAAATRQHPENPLAFVANYIRSHNPRVTSPTFKVTVDGVEATIQGLRRTYRGCLTHYASAEFLCGLLNPTTEEIQTAAAQLATQASSGVAAGAAPPPRVALLCLQPERSDLCFVNGVPMRTDWSERMFAEAHPDAMMRGMDDFAAVLSKPGHGLQAGSRVRTLEDVLEPVSRNCELRLLVTKRGMLTPGSFDAIDSVVGTSDDSPLRPILVVCYGIEDTLRNTMTAVAAAQAPLLQVRDFQRATEFVKQRSFEATRRMSVPAAQYWAAALERRERRDRARAHTEEATAKVRKAAAAAVAAAQAQANAVGNALAEATAATLGPAAAAASVTTPSRLPSNLQELHQQAAAAAEVAEKARAAAAVLEDDPIVAAARLKAQQRRHARRSVEEINALRCIAAEREGSAAKVQAVARRFLLLLRTEKTKDASNDDGAIIPVGRVGAITRTPVGSTVAPARNVCENASPLAIDGAQASAAPASTTGALLNRRRSSGAGTDLSREFFVGPAAVRRLMMRLCELHGDLITTKPPPLPGVPRIRKRWVCSASRIPPQYKDDVSSEEETWTLDKQVIPVKPQVERDPMFNPTARLSACEDDCGGTAKEFLRECMETLGGVSALQRRGYAWIHQRVLHLLHVSFLELRHRKIMPPTAVFSNYIQMHHAELLAAVVCVPHLFSQTVVPKGVPLPLLAGPADLMADRILLCDSLNPLTPWGAVIAPSTVASANAAFLVAATAAGGGAAAAAAGIVNDGTVQRIALSPVFAAVDPSDVDKWRAAMVVIQRDAPTFNKIAWISTNPHPCVFVMKRALCCARRGEQQALPEGIRGAKDLVNATIEVVPSRVGGAAAAASLDPKNPKAGESFLVLAPRAPQTGPGGNVRRSRDSVGGAGAGAGQRMSDSSGAREAPQPNWFGTSWSDMERRLRSELVSRVDNGDGVLRCFVPTRANVGVESPAAGCKPPIQEFSPAWEVPSATLAELALRPGARTTGGVTSLGVCDDGTGTSSPASAFSGNDQRGSATAGRGGGAASPSGHRSASNVSGHHSGSIIGGARTPKASGAAPSLGGRQRSFHSNAARAAAGLPEHAGAQARESALNNQSFGSRASAHAAADAASSGASGTQEAATAALSNKALAMQLAQALGQAGASGMRRASNSTSAHGDGSAFVAASCEPHIATPRATAQDDVFRTLASLATCEVEAVFRREPLLDVSNQLWLLHFDRLMGWCHRHLVQQGAPCIVFAVAQRDHMWAPVAAGLLWTLAVSPTGDARNPNAGWPQPLNRVASSLHPNHAASISNAILESKSPGHSHSNILLSPAPDLQKGSSAVTRRTTKPPADTSNLIATDPGVSGDSASSLTPTFGAAAVSGVFSATGSPPHRRGSGATPVTGNPAGSRKPSFPSVETLAAAEAAAEEHVCRTNLFDGVVSLLTNLGHTSAIADLDAFLAASGAFDALRRSVVQADEAARQHRGKAECRRFVTQVVRGVERYCWLALFTAFLAQTRSEVLLTKQLPSFAQWVVVRPSILTWMETIDPWSMSPAESPDPWHFQYTGGAQRWADEDAFVSMVI